MELPLPNTKNYFSDLSLVNDKIIPLIRTWCFHIY